MSALKLGIMYLSDITFFFNILSAWHLTLKQCLMEKDIKQMNETNKCDTAMYCFNCMLYYMPLIN